MDNIAVSLGARSYEIILRRGGLGQADRLFSLNRRVLIVTDSGVPAEYRERLAALCAQPTIFCMQSGEQSKSLENYEKALLCMLQNGFSRRDCVVALGGGVCGDLAGFVSASYMRGIDFYNIPTTVLSCVDSSVGGKTAVNLGGVKNIVGAFWQPRGVLIDPELLKTLPPRHRANGIAEALKMAVTFDAALFCEFERKIDEEALFRIIRRSVMLKKTVVEHDERESGERKLLNFGHTIGHGIEAALAGKGMLHGECVAVGMLPMCGKEIRTRVAGALRMQGLPTVADADPEVVFAALTHDKKADGKTVTIAVADALGKGYLKTVELAALRGACEAACGKAPAAPML